MGEGERLAGEWLLQAHGLKYQLEKATFVAFDFFEVQKRMAFEAVLQKIEPFDFWPPRTLAAGNRAFSISEIMEKLTSETCPNARAEGLPEGLIYRIERKGEVDFLAKFVRSDFPNGCFLAEISGEPDVWNLDPSRFSYPKRMLQTDSN